MGQEGVEGVSEEIRGRPAAPRHRHQNRRRQTAGLQGRRTAGGGRSGGRVEIEGCVW